MSVKQIVRSALLIFISTLPVYSQADVITFDDIVATTAFPSNYYGLSWAGDNVRVLDSSTYANQSSGYIAGTVSPNFVGIYRNNATITSLSGPFDFNGAYLTAAWNDGLNVLVEGKLSGATVFSESLTVNSDEAVWYGFNWQGIDQVTFASSGGANAGYGGTGAWTAIDNFTINAVPVPAAVWLFGSGWLGLIGVARRKKTA